MSDQLDLALKWVIGIIGVAVLFLILDFALATRITVDAHVIGKEWHPGYYYTIQQCTTVSSGSGKNQTTTQICTPVQQWHPDWYSAQVQYRSESWNVTISPIDYGQLLPGDSTMNVTWYRVGWITGIEYGK